MKWTASIVLTTLSLQQLRSLVRSCGRRSSFAGAGEKLHAVLTTSGHLCSPPDSFLRNSLLHFYSAAGNLSSALQLFDQIPNSHKDAADWTSLIASLLRHGCPYQALLLFSHFRTTNKTADHVAFVCASNACARLGHVAAGSQIHAAAEKEGLFFSVVRVCNALMDMYVKSAFFTSAIRVFHSMELKTVVSWTVILDGVIQSEGVVRGRELFDEMPDRNEVAWTLMIAGYVAAGLTAQALKLLGEMMFVFGLSPNHVTLCSVLSAASQSGDLIAGKWLHAYVFKTMIADNVMVETALVDMYSKCGRIDSATRVFEGTRWKNVVAWNAMMNGLAIHGMGRAAVELFHRMIEGSVWPDELTFVSLLSACSRSGLVEQGKKLFNIMGSVHGIAPTIEHYACVVDLLGRAGLLEEAVTFVVEMRVPPNEVVLGSLIASCAVHGDIWLVERVVDELAGRWGPRIADYHAYAIAGSVRGSGERKVPGMSSVRVGGEFHRFCAGDWVGHEYIYGISLLRNEDSSGE